jgi:hypothetical protein
VVWVWVIVVIPLLKCHTMTIITQTPTINRQVG